MKSNQKTNRFLPNILLLQKEVSVARSYAGVSTKVKAKLMREKNFPFYLRMLRLAFSSILIASVIFYICKSIRWQIVWDPSIMHYVNFLMSRGLAPYRDIIDINLPGSYFIEGWAMHIFGGGDLGWRFYEFSLLGTLIAALIVISLPYDWFAGLLGGVLFLSIHGQEGPRNAGQREEVMITLIMVGYALLFTSIRKRKPLFMLPFGLAMGLAGSLKPTAIPLALVLISLTFFLMRKRHIASRAYLTYGVVGLFVVLLVNLQFLISYHAIGAFLSTARRLVPYYSSIGNSSISVLIQELMLRKGIILTAGLFLLVNEKKNDLENWERLTLWLGLVFGGLSFILQMKLFDHHEYVFLVFAFFLFSLEAAKAMRTYGWQHFAGLVVIAASVFYVVPEHTFRIAAVDSFNEQPDALKSDLLRLGGLSLQKQVLCLDMVDGCFSTLYHLRLLPNTGFMGDYMFFGAVGSPPLLYYRQELWDDLHKNPPKVIVLTNMWLNVEGPPRFEKLNQWPELADYLTTNYTLDVTRIFGKQGYRIYLLNDK